MNNISFSDAELDDPALLEQDKIVVQRFVETGEPIDPMIRKRIFARTDRIRELIFQKHGYVDGTAFLLPTVTGDDEE